MASGNNNLLANYAWHACPMPLRLLVQHVVTYETGVKAISFFTKAVEAKDLYLAIAKSGVPCVLVHNNDLLVARYEQWSLQHGHLHVSHVCGDPMWDIGDDLTRFLSAQLIVAIDCPIPQWLIQPSKRVRTLRFSFV